MGKCLKCAVYKLWQFGRRAITKNKITAPEQSDENENESENESESESKYNKKVKLIFGKVKRI